MKKILALVLFLTLSISFVYAFDNAYDLYNKGYDLYLVNDYKGAADYFNRSIKAMPDFVKPYNKAGLAYIAMKQVDHAIFMYKKAVYIDPNYAEAFYNFAVALSVKDAAKNKLKITQLYQKAIDLKNDDHIFARASLNLARIYRADKKFDEAIGLVRDAIKVEPTFEELYNEAGLVYLDTELYDKAIEMFDKAVERKHEYIEASTNLAIAYQKKGNLAKAVMQLEDTLKKDDNFAGAQYNYGNALILQGFYDKAIEHLLKATRLDPKFAEAYYSLGKAYMHKDMFEQADAAFKNALRNRKNYTLAKKELENERKLQKGFRAHISFPKIKSENDETASGEEDMTEEQIAEAAKKAKEAENVEDLRLPEDKVKPKEGEEADSEGNTAPAEEF
jgi:tetratricopeptide (TPR) repeat protein